MKQFGKDMKRELEKVETCRALTESLQHVRRLTANTSIDDHYRSQIAVAGSPESCTMPIWYQCNGRGRYRHCPNQNHMCRLSAMSAPGPCTDWRPSGNGYDVIATLQLLHQLNDLSQAEQI